MAEDGRRIHTSFTRSPACICAGDGGGAGTCPGQRAGRNAVFTQTESAQRYRRGIKSARRPRRTGARHKAAMRDELLRRGVDLFPKSVPGFRRRIVRCPFLVRAPFPSMANDIVVALVRDLLANIEIAQFEHMGGSEQRFLAGIIFDDRRKIRCQRAIVGEVGAHPVGHRELAFTHAREKTRHAMATAAVEGHRIQLRRGEPA